MQKEIASFVEGLRKKNISALDEAATKNAVVLKLLSLLGWDPFDPDEVKPEYSVGKNRVDYSLRLSRSNRVFIEVKRIQEDLEKHQEQLLNYSFHEGVELAILTNGVTWWFYLPLRKGKWEDRRFYSIDLVEQESESVASRFCRYLSREAISTGEALKNAEADYKSHQRSTILRQTLPKAWNKMISEADELLLELIGETVETICGYKADAKVVKDFLVGHRQALLIRHDDEYKPPSVVPPPVIDSHVYTGKTPLAFVFKGKRHEVRTWKEILMRLCEILQARHQQQFARVLELRGSRCPYFSRDPKDLREPRQIRSSGIYAETSHSANSAVTRCKQVMHVLGHSPDALRIEAQ